MKTTADYIASGFAKIDADLNYLMKCLKEVLVVRGNENPTSRFDVLNVIGKTTREDVTYDASIFGGELGPYEPNAC